jgi:hypothetical protein
MADLILTGKVADKLRDLAERQGRTAEAVVEEMIQHYPPAQEVEATEEQQGKEPRPGSGTALLKSALAANIRTRNSDTAARSREILDKEFPEYLRQRMNRPSINEESE